MNRLRSLACTLVLAAAAASTASTANAQTLPPPQNVLQLTASASAEVAQDMLSITLAVQREGSDAAAVQSQLKQVLDVALTEARKAVRPGQLDLRSGAFAVYPRYAAKGGISGWQGRAELILEGRDTPAISQLSARLQGMVVAGVAYSLSREVRDKTEAEVAAQAIARFKARAESYARHFGFAGYSIREVNVGQADGAMATVPRLRASAMAVSNADEALPVEAGKATVSVTVSGSIQMSPR